MPLVAVDGSWALCMPKKTGSHTIVHYLSPTTHCLLGPDFAKVEGEWHGGFVPDCFHGRRLMITRDSLSRLQSMFRYSIEMREKCFRLADGNFPDFSGWLDVILRCKWKDDGTIGGAFTCPPTRYDHYQHNLQEYSAHQSEIAKQFQPDEVFRLEDGIERVFEALGVYVGTPIVRNDTKKDVDVSIPASHQKRVAEWCERDAVTMEAAA